MPAASLGSISPAVVVTILFAGGQVPSPGQSPGGGQVPTFRSGVEVVSVDVGVVDKSGVPLRGLAPADFLVTVGGRPRHVVTAEFIERPLAESLPAYGQGLVSTNEGAGVGRQFAFVVDQSMLDPGSARFVSHAASPFFSRLTYVDRSALVLMPTGPSVGFTWAHDRVRSGLQLVVGTGRPMTGWEYGGLTDARDIVNRNPFALRNISDRVCGVGSSAAASPGSSPPSGRGAAPGTAGRGASGGSGTSGAAAGADGLSMSACMRNLENQAESAWQMARLNSAASLGILRTFFGTLRRVPGDKTVLLISGGMPIDERDQVSMLSMVAADAVAARATVYSIFVPASQFTADRRTLPSEAISDVYLHAGPLQTLAAMTGGRFFRADVGADAVFEQLARELSGYYRLGIEKDPTDADGEGQRLRVRVPRSGVSIRAREMFDVRTYEDRDWAARLGSAMDAPVVATDVGLKVTSYVAVDPEVRSRMRLLLSGEASRAQPGEATLRLVVNDLQGEKVTSGDLALESRGGDTLPFATNIAVPPGSYIVRVGIMDSAGRVGSVDHRVDVRGVPLGRTTVTGPVLVRSGATESRLALDSGLQNERLAIEIGLEGEQERLEHTSVEFEIASAADGRVLLHPAAAVSLRSHEGLVLAQAVANLRVLPPGDYLVRARITPDGEPGGEVHRAFAVTAAARITGDAGNSSATAVPRMAPAASGARLLLAGAPPFTLDQVLSAPVLNVFLDRVAARPDATTPATREWLARARAQGPSGLAISESQASADPVAAFLRGVALLSENRLEAAASAFRAAMRASVDFYPAMVYLGACYAAGGRDKEAAGAWRTAIIREGDAVALHVLLADAWLRQDRAELALEDLEAARSRWPEDVALTRRFAVAALLAGRQIEGLQALDALVERKADDAPALEVALLMLYEAFETRQPIETVEKDRARMVRLADRYRAGGGSSIALVDAWLAVVAGKQ